VLEGLKKGGLLIINSGRRPDELGLPPDFRLVTVNASAIAEKHNLGFGTARPVNTAILGALARVTGLVSLASLEKAIRKEVPAKVEENVAAAREAFELAGMQ
jgi:pyruvate ferredoxin oxidoreductase gamma subunit/2-oxoisovalerate ferredoxin oxidoreductase gamma subunit